MTDTPQDPPQNDPASPVDQPAAAATPEADSHQEQPDAATNSTGGKKPWWKIWA
jgi:hypothetical protein